MNKIAFIIALPNETESISSILGYPIIYSGVGKINAVMAVYKAFNMGYKQIVNIGSCGSFTYSIGEIVKVGSVFQDIDGTPLCSYGETPFEDNSKQIILDKYQSTTCFTTDYFYDHNQITKYSQNYLNMVNYCNILDMECFALAKTCKNLNIRFSSYKWVSDNGEKNDWIKNCKTGLKEITNILHNKSTNNW